MNTIEQLNQLIQQGYTLTVKETLGATVVLVTEAGKKTVRGRQLIDTTRTVALGRAGTVAGAIENAHILAQRDRGRSEHGETQ